MLFRYENIKNSHSFIMPSLFSEQRNSLDVRWDFLFMVNQYHIEIWAWIPGYEGMYQASTLGEVRSFYNARYGLKPTPQKILKDIWA